MYSSIKDSVGVEVSAGKVLGSKTKRGVLEGKIRVIPIEDKTIVGISGNKFREKHEKSKIDNGSSKE